MKKKVLNKRLDCTAILAVLDIEREILTCAPGPVAVRSAQNCVRL